MEYKFKENDQVYFYDVGTMTIREGFIGIVNRNKTHYTVFVYDGEDLIRLPCLEEWICQKTIENRKKLNDFVKDFIEIEYEFSNAERTKLIQNYLKKQENRDVFDKFTAPFNKTFLDGTPPE